MTIKRRPTNIALVFVLLRPGSRTDEAGFLGE
jgi:hypothetical protein